MRIDSTTAPYKRSLCVTHAGCGSRQPLDSTITLAAMCSQRDLRGGGQVSIIGTHSRRLLELPRVYHEEVAASTPQNLMLVALNDSCRADATDMGKNLFTL